MWPYPFLFFGSSCGIIIPVVSTVAFCFISYGIFKWLASDNNIPICDVTKRHNWQSIHITARAWYCSICESLLLNGFGLYCDCCGVCADHDCVKKADKKFPCKINALPPNMQNETSMQHHWVKGNLPTGAVCYICDEDCSMEPGLVDKQCCWCQRCVHIPCLDNNDNDIDKICDLGPYRSLIVPPWSVKTVRRRSHSTIRKHLHVRAVKGPDWPEWTPLLVIGNCRSGNGDGALVLSEFRRILNPSQVFDLSETTPDSALLHWCKLLTPHNVKVLVAGGDGTVAWILDTILQLHLDPVPGVAIVPLGTGNDLSRVLGWGKSYTPDNIHVLVQQLLNGQNQQLDRWNIEITPVKHLRLLRMPSRGRYMYNYLSIGVDAQVALDFHRTRESKLYLFSSRVFNKLLYLLFGTHQVVAADCRNLEQRLDVHLDGEPVVLPELEAIVVLNISSWGAGVDLWSDYNATEPQAYDDGKLEVIGIYSSFHMAQLQVGLAEPHRIGQARSVEIRLFGTSAVQIDGEPWEQHPAYIRISGAEPATVLVTQ